MWLLVAAAILGAFLGLCSLHRVLAAVITAALTAVGHLVLSFWAAHQAGDTDMAQVLFGAVGLAGLNGYVAMLAGVAACVIAGLLASQLDKAPATQFYIPKEGDFQPRRGMRGVGEPGSSRSSAREARLKTILDL
jgi:hypothetical protein